jgi:hypothetical protein
LEFLEPPKRLPSAEREDVMPQAIVSASPYTGSRKALDMKKGSMNISQGSLENMPTLEDEALPANGIKVEGSLEKLLNAGRGPRPSVAV